MGKPHAPTPPDPAATAAAQSASNADTARLDANLNRYNTAGPTGNVDWTHTGDNWTQSTTLSPQEQAVYDQTKAAQAGAVGVANSQLGRVADALGQGFNYTGLPDLQGAVHSGQIQTGYGQTPGLQTGFDPGQGVQGSVQPGAPIQTGYNAGGPIQSGVNTGQDLTGTFNHGQAVQGQVGPTDFTKDRNDVTDAVWAAAKARLDPEFGLQQNQLDTRLANQGIGHNSAAYGNSQDIFQRGRNDAYGQALNSAIGQGAAEQQALAGQRLSQGQFANQAAAQGFGQGQAAAQFANQAALDQYNRNLSAAQFGNQAQSQQYGQNQGQAQFANAAAQQQLASNVTQGQFANSAAAQQYGQNQGQAGFANQASNDQFSRQAQEAGFANQAEGQQYQQELGAANLSNAARSQGGQERAYAQNLPINEFNSLMSSSQVGMPTANASQVNVAPTDYLGAVALNQQAQNVAYQAKMANQSSTMGGLMSLGQAAIMASDVRLKTNIVRVGEQDGYGIYRFNYLGCAKPYVGVLAQEVALTRPDAVVNDNGMLLVNYGAL